MKRANIWKGHLPLEMDGFEHYYTCWANNHRGWAKQKAFNRRKAKRRYRQREMKEQISEIIDLNREEDRK